ncbi:unnamed protein product [Moneuplotes crassus]|uniref:Vacuolar ATP synthase subunit E n=2 Tax=Euplotes crassus TaxID=5936 RepID=A0AAD2D3H8_EUPCR|nr:unnamed protein product [Moneuplotes crassus]
MDSQDSGDVLTSMIQFINNHGEEQAEQLKREAEQEFTIECEKIIGNEKDRLDKIFESRLEQEGVEMKIKQSKARNTQRIKKMVERNKWAEEVFKDAQTRLQERMAENTDEYKELLKNLIVQSLIKLMETNVKVMCRQSDEELVTEVLDEAAQTYKDLMKDNVKMLNGAEPPLNIQIDPKKYLPEYNPDNPSASCSGGVKLHARKGRIVISNTLDDRLGLCYQESTPKIRKLLYPSY